jgi:hypothetical protein
MRQDVKRWMLRYRWAWRMPYRDQGWAGEIDSRRAIIHCGLPFGQAHQNFSAYRQFW